MPNWCQTDITFVANRNEGQRAIDALHDLYEKIRTQCNGNTSLMDNGFGSEWLGNFAIMYKLIEPEQINNNNTNPYHCRGSIESVEELEGENESSFYIQTEEAWTPCLAMWQEIIRRYYSINGVALIEMYYFADEPGSEIYDTNDTNGYYYDEVGYIDLRIPFVPNVFPFITQAPNSPFMKVDTDVINNLESGFYYNGVDKYNTEPSIEYYERFINEEGMIKVANSMLLKEPVSNLGDAYKKCEDLNKQFYNYYEGDDNGIRHCDPYIIFQTMGYCSIEDMNRVEKSEVNWVNSYAEEHPYPFGDNTGTITMSSNNITNEPLID